MTGDQRQAGDLFRTHGFPAAARWRFVWLDRDPGEQARSHVKFLSSFMTGLDEDAVARFAASFPRDRSQAIGQLHGGGSVLTLRFEDVLADPPAAAGRLRRAVWPDLDVAAAAAVVHRRDGRCLPDLSTEEAFAPLRGVR